VVSVSERPALDRLARERRVSPWRLAAGGVGAALIAAALGVALQVWLLGVDEAAAIDRLQRRVTQEFADMTARVERVAQGLAADPRVPGAMAPGSDERVRDLFDAVAAARGRHPDETSGVAITVYTSGGVARAWAGRPSDLPPERMKTDRALFVTPSPLGLRLVHVTPIVASTPDAHRLGAIAVEQVVTETPVSPAMGAGVHHFEMETPVAPVTLRLPGETAPADPDAYSFAIAAPDGSPLVVSSVSRADVQAALDRARWQIAALVVAIAGITLLLLAGPLLDRRASARQASREIRMSAAIAVVIASGAALEWLAIRMMIGGPLSAPVVLVLTGAAAAALAATAVSGAVRLRIALRAARRPPHERTRLFVLAQLACGVLLACLLAGFERLLGMSVDPASIDLRHFSLHPWSGPRLAVLLGILLYHAAILWAGALGCVTALAPWRTPHRLSRWHVTAALLWIVPTVLVAAASAARAWPIPASAIVLAAIACAGAALGAPRLTIWYRQTTVASRILALFMAFLLPALLIYPSVHFFAERSTRHLIETRYAVQAMNHLQDLQDRLAQARQEIDAIPELPRLITAAAASAEDVPRTDPAFSIWSRTVLARTRLTSDVELYDEAGRLVSRFALNFPEYTNTPQKALPSTGCRWDVFGEAQPFGAQERNMLHSGRSICVGGRVLGTVVVHVVLDYRTLPFVSSQSAYLELFRPSGSGPVEGTPAGDVDFTVYGWGLTAIFTSGGSAWPLDEATFARVYESRQPFWTVLTKEKTPYNVYFANDRFFIYALGYARPGLFDHLVRLAELTTLAAAGYVVILIGSALFARISRERPQTGRALLREIRASFYRKLFLAFVLASIVPVLTLALVIRAYFAGLLLGDIRAEASRTAAVAQRVIEESEAMLRRGTEGLTPFGDDVMIWISQVIDQDVNIFDGPELLATSERDLFASGLLPTRTPEDVYRAIVLQRLPSYVSEDSIGGVPYMLAATPVRAESRNAILTVPLAFRQQEVEREIDDLDRGLHLAALFFILLGAGIGLSMAERIADPVRRLTRATGRIASGDFDARIAVRSSDELRRLVDAFNSMAAELKEQRVQLERTNRLEAWAEMARQVAHEIKNPLTPIQLSAEHLRRVHADRGTPLSPVLEGCVDAILGQVHLLRQIAAEFSSFASSPTARFANVDPVQLVHDVVEPYRAGLEGRIAIENKVDGPLPAVYVDKTLVSRALANVVENALHAMPGSGRLLVTSDADESVVSISVSDTGVGMDAEALERVFEPYFSTKTPATGLGVPIARRNVELSGGKIEVLSEKGRGTTVIVRLPVAAAAG
jgi:signal transduction histidine kinase